MSVNVIANPNLFVITGGPGAGKTTLLQEVARHGILCVPEAARQIIQEQVASGGDAVPWGDTTRYTEMMLRRSVADFVKHSDAPSPTFFDRGIPDVLCYARLINLGQHEIKMACDKYRYNSAVFIAPPCPEIYVIDSERKQTFAEAVKTYRVMSQAYRDCGYEPIELPKVGPEERAEFVLRTLDKVLGRNGDVPL